MKELEANLSEPVDDFKMTKLCADAMYIPVKGFIGNAVGHYWRIDKTNTPYDPLRNDAQNGALLFWLSCEGEVIAHAGEFQFNCDDPEITYRHGISRLGDLRRAVVEAGAALWMAKPRSAA